MTLDNPTPSRSPIRVLLVDDQPIIGESVRRMLADQSDVNLEYCQDPTEAIQRANDFGPTVILQDLVMPDVDGLTLVRFFRANPRTRDVPLIVLSTKEEPTVKAEAFGRGANDYLVKLPDRVELIARIRYHSRGYIALLERNEAYRRLAESRKQLADEIDQAAAYVRSLLPAPVSDGPVITEWRFVPSTQLGGDSFGYHWLDEDHFALYLLDVSGHGVGASLMSVSAMNVLGSHSLPNVDFHDPSQVLGGLDVAFDMDRHDGKYFTIWYGVYQPSSRILRYAGGGHPPAALFAGATPADAELMLFESDGPAIGFGMGAAFESQEAELPAYARMYLYSDGAFEVQIVDGPMWTHREFLDYLGKQQGQPAPMDIVLEYCTQLHGSATLDDDCSILQCEFR
jgi:sigma-B regulation protein RsbU (phosphoserine phosphatase)